MNKPIICFDFDDCIADYTSLVESCSTVFADTTIPETYKEYDFSELGLTPRRLIKTIELADSRVLEMKPILGACEMLRGLLSAGYELEILTAKPAQYILHIKTWLYMNKFPTINISHSRNKIDYLNDRKRFGGYNIIALIEDNPRVENVTVQPLFKVIYRETKCNINELTSKMLRFKFYHQLPKIIKGLS